MISRRDALKILGAGAAALALSPYVRAEKLMEESSLRELMRPQRPQGMPPLKYDEPVVYEGLDVIIRQIDAHTWEGNGHLMAGETIYIIEGENKAILIDAVAFKRVHIQPHLGEIKEIGGTMHHPAGSISVHYLVRGKKLQAEIILPEGVDGTFVWKEKKHYLRSGKNTINQ